MFFLGFMAVYYYEYIIQGNGICLFGLALMLGGVCIFLVNPIYPKLLDLFVALLVTGFLVGLFFDVRYWIKEYEKAREGQ